MRAHMYVLLDGHRDTFNAVNNDNEDYAIKRNLIEQHRKQSYSARTIRTHCTTSALPRPVPTECSLRPL